MASGGAAPKARNDAQRTAMSKTHHIRPPTSRGSRRRITAVASRTPSPTAAPAWARRPGILRASAAAPSAPATSASAPIPGISVSPIDPPPASTPVQRPRPTAASAGLRGKRHHERRTDRGHGGNHQRALPEVHRRAEGAQVRVEELVVVRRVRRHGQQVRTPWTPFPYGDHASAGTASAPPADADQP